MGKKRKRPESEVERVMMDCERRMRSIKSEKKKARCNCMHKSDNGKIWYRKYGPEEDAMLRCKKCRRKINMKPLAGKSADEVRKYIKNVFNAGITLCDIVKMNIMPKTDKKYAKMVCNAQYSMVQMKKLAKIIIGDSIKNLRKHEGKKKRRKNSGFTMAAGGSSLF